MEAGHPKVHSARRSPPAQHLPPRRPPPPFSPGTIGPSAHERGGAWRRMRAHAPAARGALEFEPLLEPQRVQWVGRRCARHRADERCGGLRRRAACGRRRRRTPSACQRGDGRASRTPEGHTHQDWLPNSSPVGGWCSYVVVTHVRVVPSGVLAAVPPLGDLLRALGYLRESHLLKLELPPRAVLWRSSVHHPCHPIPIQSHQKATLYT